MDWDGDAYTELMGDCDDFSALASPGVEEACDEIDNDCDGYVDEGGAVGAAYWYADTDSDGYGHLSSSVFSCAPPDGFVSDNGDCDDRNADINPGVEEIWYDGIDGNCDGWSDFDSDFDEYDSSTYGGDDYPRMKTPPSIRWSSISGTTASTQIAGEKMTSMRI